VAGVTACEHCTCTDHAHGTQQRQQSLELALAVWLVMLGAAFFGVMLLLR
jgi:type VI protein secretion system component VasF